MIRFFVPCEPPTSLSKNNKQLFIRDGRACMTDAKTTREAKKFVTLLATRFAPKDPMEGPLRVVVRFCYPFPTSTPKRVVALGVQPKVTRPDVDGIASGVLDCLTALGFWRDDAQVTELTVGKSVGPKPGIYILVEPDVYEVELPALFEKTGT